MSRQIEWQKRQVTLGNCAVCGEPRDGKSTYYCEKHRLEYNARKWAKYQNRKKNQKKKKGKK